MSAAESAAERHDRKARGQAAAREALARQLEPGRLLSRLMDAAETLIFHSGDRRGWGLRRREFVRLTTYYLNGECHTAEGGDLMAVLREAVDATPRFLPGRRRKQGGQCP